jgi:hypothetical protein
MYAPAGCTSLPGGSGGTAAVIGSPDNPVILVLNNTTAGQLSMGTSSGNITVVYDDTSVSGDTHKLPTSARFGRVAGSWLDSGTAF